MDRLPRRRRYTHENGREGIGYMCGRFFWNDDAEDALEEDFPQLAQEARRLKAGDYTPAMSALAVVGGTGGSAASALNAASSGSAASALNAASSIGAAPPLTAELIKWGFPGFDRGRLLINARAESVKERPTFADSFALRRCVLPAAGFYEWDKKKEKVTFTVPDSRILYLAGIYRLYGDELRFVVLTREANASMAPVHDRMPLILSEEEVLPWVTDTGRAGDILTKELPMLKAERPYEQMTFEW